MLLPILLAVVQWRGFLYLCIFESIIDFGFLVGVYLVDVVAGWVNQISVSDKFDKRLPIFGNSVAAAMCVVFFSISILILCTYVPEKGKKNYIILE